jgi:diaminopropionate ammonia-lyase
VEAGESGAVGIGLMDLLANHTDFEAPKDDLKISSDSTLLCFNTEGATDPLNYQEIIWHGKYPSGA